jgi:hypothetical protein
MSTCAAQRGLDICVDCPDYPCPELKQFQAEAPLWEDLAQIKAVGYQQWLTEVNKKYTCPHCQTLNPAYDLKCRRCGREPSCGYVAKHRPAIEPFS